MKTIAVLGGVFGFLAVAAGAFGAHALKSRITPENLVVFETAARYQMYHALAMLFTVWLAARGGGGTAPLAGRLFAVGIVVFSGSLYALALTGTRALGAITPIGGIFFLAGWLLLAVAAYRSL